MTWCWPAGKGDASRVLRQPASHRTGWQIPVRSALNPPRPDLVVPCIALACQVPTGHASNCLPPASAFAGLIWPLYPARGGRRPRAHDDPRPSVAVGCGSVRSGEGREREPAAGLWLCSTRPLGQTVGDSGARGCVGEGEKGREEEWAV